MTEDPIPIGEYFRQRAPGVYRREQFGSPRRRDFQTGVPAFLGRVKSAAPGVIGHPQRLTLWSQYTDHVGTADQECLLAYAVRGFFQNGGTRCYAVVLKDETEASLRDGLKTIEGLDIDLVCVPDLGALETKAGEQVQETARLQQIVVEHCERLGDRFAILDSHKGDDTESVWTQWAEIDGKNGALYYPWLIVAGFEQEGKQAGVKVPPCGHVAGVYARTDNARGVHKAPANEVVEGVIDLERHITSLTQNELNPHRVNCIRSFPGRGVRVWGARTLSGHDEWTYVNVRRVFLTAVRWINWNMTDVAFEPHTPKLWARVERELDDYFLDLHRQGALKGRTPDEAYFVKCDAETNPREIIDSGQVVAEIGLAPALPYEFVMVRLIYGASGVSISGPNRPEQNQSRVDLSTSKPEPTQTKSVLKRQEQNH